MYEYEKYISTPETVKDTINKYGVAIVPNILNDEECDEMINEMWNYLEYITQDWNIPIKRENTDSYKNIYKLFLQDQYVYFIIKFWYIGHCQMAWNVRQNIKIVDVFAKFWDVNSDDLLVSFDSSAIHMPPEFTGKWRKQNYWYHTDQSYDSNDFTYLQSWVTAFDVNDGDATLAFLESSNNIREQFIEEFYKNNSDYTILDDNQIKYFLDHGCLEKKIKCPKGSLVLWDSRTIHCGIEPSESRIKPNFRCVSYLCYAPRKYASEEDIILKQKIFNQMYTTTHDPIKCNIIPKSPYYSNNNYTKVINKPKLTDLGLKLAGF
jgi:ectoine hydroxylase-related dioxygenase (phytanoyl-CoA dioxygenase family)